MSKLFNEQLLSSFDAADFAWNQPCPWFCFAGLLTDKAFQKLHAEFPPLDLFEKHQEKSWPDQRRPHHRYYLAFEKSIYHDRRAGTPGCVRMTDLSPGWQQFIHQLQSDGAYSSFIKRLLHVDEMKIRFAWHVAGAGEDVSPHCDSQTKAGTQIFYFNTSAEWREEWGGGTVFLRNQKNDSLHPEVGDFEEMVAASILDNRCLLFKNTPDAWHAVEPLCCPAGSFRRVFNVIFEHPHIERPQAKGPRFWKRFTRRIFSKNL